MNENGCERCGHCCIVFVNIPLTKEEVDEELYAKKWGPSILDTCPPFIQWQGSLNKSGWMVIRTKVFISELGREVFACVYWDPKSRECLIFEDRPQVCRGFDCHEKERDAYVREVWGILEKGERDRDCLHA